MRRSGTSSRTALEGRWSGWVPSVAAALTIVVAALNLASTLTPNVSWRGRLIRRWLPLGTIPLFHALVLPAAAALLLVGMGLARRRQRAALIAALLLFVLGVFDLLKGLDFEEATVSWVVAAGLWRWRGAFVVRPAPLRTIESVRLALAVSLGSAVLVAVAVWATAPGAPPSLLVLRETADALLWRQGPIAFRRRFRWLPQSIELLSLAAISAIVWLALRPLPATRMLPSRAARRRAQQIVHAYGSDSLAFFALRPDKQYLFSRDRAAFLAYTIRQQVLLVCGDPVGPREALPALIAQGQVLANRHGLRFAVLGASATLLPLYDDHGLHSVYLGDEAIVETARFSLEGRRIRKVRQAVARIERAGYRVEVRQHKELDEATLSELEHVSAVWRRGEPERGFTMAMDGLRGSHQADCLLVLARSGDDTVGGFLHLVPSYGRPAFSLAAMRRLPSTPNGLMEFLIVRAIEDARKRGIEELSLNFAIFARVLHAPNRRGQRLLGYPLGIADRFFQIERLHRFNAKFEPRWEPRYIVIDRWRSAPRTALAALHAEGQLPLRLRPRLLKPQLRQ